MSYRFVGDISVSAETFAEYIGVFELFGATLADVADLGDNYAFLVIRGAERTHFPHFANTWIWLLDLSTVTTIGDPISLAETIGLEYMLAECESAIVVPGTVLLRFGEVLVVATHNSDHSIVLGTAPKAFAKDRDAYVSPLPPTGYYPDFDLSRYGRASTSSVPFAVMCPDGDTVTLTMPVSKWREVTDPRKVTRGVNFMSTRVSVNQSTMEITYAGWVESPYASTYSTIDEISSVADLGQACTSGGVYLDDGDYVSVGGWQGEVSGDTFRMWTQLSTSFDRYDSALVVTGAYPWNHVFAHQVKVCDSPTTTGTIYAQGSAGKSTWYFADRFAAPFAQCIDFTEDCPSGKWLVVESLMEARTPGGQIDYADPPDWAAGWVRKYSGLCSGTVQANPDESPPGAIQIADRTVYVDFLGNTETWAMAAMLGGVATNVDGMTADWWTTPDEGTTKTYDLNEDTVAVGTGQLLVGWKTGVSQFGVTTSTGWHGVWLLNANREQYHLYEHPLEPSEVPGGEYWNILGHHLSGRIVLAPNPYLDSPEFFTDPRPCPLWSSLIDKDHLTTSAPTTFHDLTLAPLQYIDGVFIDVDGQTTDIHYRVSERGIS